MGLITDEQLTNRALCEETRMCNWAFCNDLEDADCTLENCLDPLVNQGDYYCEACFGQNDCFEVRTITALRHCVLIPIYRALRTHTVNTARSAHRRSASTRLVVT